MMKFHNTKYNNILLEIKKKYFKTSTILVQINRYNSNSTVNNNIFDFLGINVGSITSSPQTNELISGYIKSSNFLHENLSLILNCKETDLKTKQKQLEQLSQELQNFNIELNYNIPEKLKSLIEKLDLYLLSLENLNNNDITPYLPSIIATNLGNHSEITRSNKTKKMKEVIDLLKTILKVYKFLNNSFGLFLIYNLLTLLRFDTNNEKLRKQIKQQNSLKKKIIFNITKSENGKFLLNISRIQITSHLGTNLVESFIVLRNACLFDLQQIALKNHVNMEVFNTLTDSEKYELICEYLSTDEKQLELYKLLYNFKDSSITPVNIGYLGIHCVYILESINILVDNELIRNKNKTHSQVYINQKYADDIFSIPSRPKNLPMVVRPNFWLNNKDPKKRNNLNYGGYLYNKKFNYPAILNHNKKGITVISNADLETINYIQSNYYKINIKFLNYMKNNFKQVIKYYLINIPNIKLLIENFDLETPALTLLSINDLFFKDTELAELKKQLFKNNSNSKLIKNEITKRQEKLLESYKTVATHFFQLIHAFILAYNFKNYKFYFNIFIDSRGRLYYRSSDASFGLQCGDLAKNIIDLTGNNYYSEPIVNSSLNFLENKNLNAYYSSLDPIKNYFSEKRFNIDQPTIIGFDASCSGTSILSAIVGSSTGLILTNVFTFPNDLTGKRCIYNHFLEYMIDNWPFNWTSLYTEEQVAKKCSEKELNIDVNWFTTNVNEILVLIKDKLLIRKHAKEFVMRKNYVETNIGRSDYIFNEIYLPFLIEQGWTIESSLQYSMIKSVCFRLAQWIENLYKQVFKNISSFSDLIVEHFKNKNSITLSSSKNDSNYTYQQLQSVTIKIPRPTLKTKKKINTKKLKNKTYINKKSTINYNIISDSPDFKKIERSLVANLVHYLDSRLCLMVIEQCKINKILVWSNHDCFYVHLKNKKTVLKYYYQSFIKLLLENNVIEHFLNINEIKIDKQLENAIKTYNKNRSEILQKIKFGELVMSNYILSEF